MTKSRIIFAAAALAASLPLCGHAADAPSTAARNPSPPNIILIISDDHGWGDYGFMGHPHVRTPRIDRLATEGLTFTRGYVTTALCSPSLASILTGLNPHQHGITGNDPVGKGDREPWLERFFQNPMLPRLLADAGYLTLHTGKYWMRTPSAAGFTSDMGETDRAGGVALKIGRKTMEPIDSFIDKAQAERKPFFVWYAPFLPHTPHTPPQRLLDHYAQIADPDEARYLAMIEWLDETCGHLMDQLKAKGLDENTLIFYIADNGWGESGKGSPYENGVRTPIIIRWPARVRPQMDKQSLASVIDVVPTLLAAARVPAPKALPGVNLLDASAVAGRDSVYLANFAHNMLSADTPGASLWSRSCIRGDWKLISWQENPPKEKPIGIGWRWKKKDAAARHELFDLASDPRETTNLAAKQPEKVAELQSLIDVWWNPNAQP